MHLLSGIHINNHQSVQFFHGDLTKLSPKHQVDVLFVSAYPGIYDPNPESLIGALHNNLGISVENLARNPAVDLRVQFHCWLSTPLDKVRVGFNRILCFEPDYKLDRSPNAVGDAFRALLPFVYEAPAIRSVAIPLLTAGTQRSDPHIIFKALVEASVNWLGEGLPIEEIKIVEINERLAQSLSKTMKQWQQNHLEGEKRPQAIASEFDVFVSYSRKDERVVAQFVRALNKENPSLKIFWDIQNLEIGAAWQDQLFRAIEASTKVIAFLSPDYLASKICIEEFNLALMLHRERNYKMLQPIYLREVQPSLPAYMRMINYVDCREADMTRLYMAAVDFSKYRR